MNDNLIDIMWFFLFFDIRDIIIIYNNPKYTKLINNIIDQYYILLLQFIRIYKQDNEIRESEITLQLNWELYSYITQSQTNKEKQNKQKEMKSIMNNSDLKKYYQQFMEELTKEYPSS